MKYPKNTTENDYGDWYKAISMPISVDMRSEHATNKLESGG